jgi:hypothetical protein
MTEQEYEQIKDMAYKEIDVTLYPDSACQDCVLNKKIYADPNLGNFFRKLKELVK